MSRDELLEHGGYLGDHAKLQTYEAALKEIIHPTSRVLDLGAGSGILGLLAARAGAGMVYSVDSGSIIGSAEAIAKANGLADRMTFMQASSTDLRLPEPVDVVVGDQMGGMVYDAGVLEYYADARERLLAPDGLLVPGAFRLMAAPVGASFWEEAVGVWARRPADFDMTTMFELAVNTEFRAEIPAAEYLGPPSEWASIASDHNDAIAGETDLTIEQPGTLNAVVGLFVAQLSPSTTLTNCPLLPNSFDRWQNVYPLPEPVDVVEGDVVHVRFDIRPKSYLATWVITVNSSLDPGSTIRSRGSTVMGMFLTPADVQSATASSVIELSPLIAADRCALELVDGSRSLEAILDLLWERHGSAFRSREYAQMHLQQLLRHQIDGQHPWSASHTE